MHCYLQFKLRYLKNLESFSTRVKGLFEPIDLQRIAGGFLLFFKAFFLSDLFVTLRDFTKTKKWEGNLHLTSNRLSRNETWRAADNYNYMCAKGFLD